MMYRVMIDDNFHYMDEDERCDLGTFASRDAAIAAARAIVDAYLLGAYTPGMTADALFEHYTLFGPDPFILAPDQDTVSFSAWEYARCRCKELLDGLAHL